MEHEQHDQHAEELEREAQKLEDHSEKVGERIEEARREWEAKEGDSRVPGAQPDDEEETMTETPEQSDQLPEEAPADQVHDDAPADDGEEPSPGGPGEEGTATGNPDAAGSDEGAEDEEDHSAD